MKKAIRLLPVMLTVAVSASAFLVGCGGGNDLTHVDANPATCTQAGNIEYWKDGDTYYSDKDGKNEISAQDVVLGALGHDESAENFIWTWNSEKTSASVSYACSRGCGFTQEATATISTSTENATCGEDGQITYTATAEIDGKTVSDVKYQTLPASGAHDFGENEYQSDGDYHWKHCNVCDKDIQASHTWKWEIDKEPTETAVGYKHEECSVCHEERNQNTEIPALSTSLRKVEAKPASCTETGNIEYWTDGFHYYRDEAKQQPISQEDTVLDMLPHSYGETYITDGNNHWYACTVCGTEKDKAVHQFGWITDKEPTETEVGYKHEECNVCEYKRNENTVIPATGPAVVIVKVPAEAATCTAAGHGEYYTDGNGNYFSDAEGQNPITLESVTIAALGHNYNAPVFTWNGTASATATATADCSRNCGHSDTKTAEITVTTNAPTCTEEGSTVYTAKVTFGETEYTDDTSVPVAALGHEFISVYETADGKFYEECANGCTHKREVGVFSDRTVTVNEVQYTPFTCYTDHADSGVTYNALTQNFVIDPSHFADGLTIAANNNPVEIFTETATSIASFSFTHGWGGTALYFCGKGMLTVAGSFTSTDATDAQIKGNVTVNGTMTANNLMVTGNLTVNNTLTTINFTVGDENGETAPTVTVNPENGNGITNNGIFGLPATNYRFLSGITSVNRNGGGSGLSIEGGNANRVTIGTHATLSVTGFINGIYLANENSAVNVEGGILTIANCSTGFFMQNAGSLLSVTGGTLIVSNCEWGVNGGTVSLESGKAVIMRNGGQDYAAFQGCVSLTVSEEFDLGIKNLSQLVYLMDNSTVDVKCTVTTENVKDIANGLPAGVTVNSQNGTVNV